MLCSGARPDSAPRYTPMRVAGALTFAACHASSTAGSSSARRRSSCSLGAQSRSIEVGQRYSAQLGSGEGTEAATVHGKPCTSNSVTCATAVLPLASAASEACQLAPSGVTAPTPRTYTARALMDASFCLECKAASALWCHPARSAAALFGAQSAPDW